MPALVLILPGRLDTLTGGYGYDRSIVAGLRDVGWSVIVRELDGSFPFPTPAALDDAGCVLAAIEDDATVLIDGLALGAMAVEAEREATRLRLVALVHHPLAAETGLDPAAADALEASERRALAATRHVVVTSQATAAALTSYGVPRDCVTVIEPGTDRAPLARSYQPFALSPSSSALRPQPVALLCVASLVPRKGHDVLFRALAAMSAHDWRLTCVGSLDHDPSMVERLRAQLRADGLTDRVQLVGEMDAAALAAQYDGADVFVLPTFYEGYGMAVAEALARGIPVVSTPTGAIADLVGLGQADHAAGVLVPSGDAAALAAALSRIVADRELRRQLAEGARRVRDLLPTWTDAAALMARVLSAA
jgi:glycosyltransferase involved in cell wall biosynthesis